MPHPRHPADRDTLTPATRPAGLQPQQTPTSCRDPASATCGRPSLRSNLGDRRRQTPQRSSSRQLGQTLTITSSSLPSLTSSTTTWRSPPCSPRARRVLAGWWSRCLWREQSRSAGGRRGAHGQVRAGRRSVGPGGAASSVSGSSGGACLGGMHVTYLVITILAALANGYAASLNFVGAESVKVVADRVQVSRRWMVPLGTLLASRRGRTSGRLRGAGAGDGCSDRPRRVLHLRCDRSPTSPRPPDRRGRVLLAPGGGGPDHERRLPQPLVTDLIPGAGS